MRNSTYNQLVTACKAEQRDASLIGMLFTKCTLVEGMKLRHIDFVDPNKATDLKWSNNPHQ